MIENFSVEDTERILQALYAGRTVEAVKLYRTGTGCDLKTAVDFIRQLNERLRRESPEKFSAKALQRGNPLLLVVMLAAIGVAVIAGLFVARAKQVPAEKAQLPPAAAPQQAPAPAAQGP